MSRINESFPDRIVRYGLIIEYNLANLRALKNSSTRFDRDTQIIGIEKRPYAVSVRHYARVILGLTGECLNIIVLIKSYFENDSRKMVKILNPKHTRLKRVANKKRLYATLDFS